MPFRPALTSKREIDRLRQDCLNLLITFVIALSCGWLFLQLNLPAPFMMGSLFGVWVSGGTFPKLRPYLGVAQWFRQPVILGLGVLIGATFTDAFFSQMFLWQNTVITMIITTITITALGFVFLTKIRGYDRNLALLCSIPGGQAEAVIIAKETTDKDYVVALFHLVRVVVVFVSTPLLLAFIQGQDAVASSNIALETMPSIFALPSNQLFTFMALALGGYGLARLCRLPLPYLLGPLLLSMIVHVSGLAALPRVNEFVILAQLVIGGGVGARLSRVPLQVLARYLLDALAASALILSAYLLSASAMMLMLGGSFLSFWLAFVPGGLYEVTLLALVFGFDVAFTAAHHTVRTMMIFIGMPVLARRMRKPEA